MEPLEQFIVRAHHRGHTALLALPLKETQYNLFGAGIRRGSCWQSAPNFPVSSVNGLFTVLTNPRGCVNPFSTNPAPSWTNFHPRAHTALASITTTQYSLTAASLGSIGSCFSCCQDLCEAENWSTGTVVLPPSLAGQHVPTLFDRVYTVLATEAGAPRKGPFKTLMGEPSSHP